MRKLDHSVIVVTGAARGLGRAMTAAFLDSGARVAALDRSWEPTGFSGDRDEAFLNLLRGHGDNALKLPVDVTDDAAVARAYDETLNRFGAVDVLVNNAAMRQRELFPPAGRVTTLETTDSDWRRMFDVNLFGVLSVTRHFVQPMIESRSGSVISVASSGALQQSVGGGYRALRPNSREMPYQATKAALITLMFYLADELRGNNVAVNTVIPGHTRTTGFDEQNAARRRMQMASGVSATAALTPKHMLPLVKLLAEQDAGNGMTGRAFDVSLWNEEHGLGGPNRWIDEEAEAGIAAALAGGQGGAPT